MKEIFEAVELEIIALDDVITDLDLFQARVEMETQYWNKLDHLEQKPS